MEAVLTFMLIGILFLGVLFIVFITTSTPKEIQDIAKNSNTEELSLSEETLSFVHGKLNPMMVCPHCQTTGQIRTKLIDQKKGISGGKATAAVLTGGASIIVTGLSRKEKSTQAHCMACNNTWLF